MIYHAAEGLKQNRGSLPLVEPDGQLSLSCSTLGPHASVQRVLRKPETRWKERLGSNDLLKDFEAASERQR